MEERFIDLGILEGDGRNVFDDIASGLESHRISFGGGGMSSGFKDDEIEKNIVDIERLLMDIEEKNPKNSKYISDESNKLLKVWYEVWITNNANDAISIAFSDNLLQLKKILEKSIIIIEEKDLKNIFTQFHTNEAELKKIAEANKAPLETVMEYFIKDSFNKVENFSLKDISTNIKKFFFTKKIINEGIDAIDKEFLNNANSEFIWDVDVSIEGEVSANDFAYFLWTFTEALGTINGVRIEIESIVKGSWKINFKIFIKDLFAKEEVKQVLNKARNSAEAYLEKPSVEVDKLKQEKELLEAQRLKVNKETGTIPDIEKSKRTQELSIRKLEVEIESKEIENALKKIEAMEKISQLVKSGIVRVDSISININDLLYMLKVGNTLKSGSDIDDISENEKSKDKT